MWYGVKRISSNNFPSPGSQIGPRVRDEVLSRVIVDDEVTHPSTNLDI